MQYRQMGKSGVRVSVIGLGTNRFGSERMPQEEVTRVIDAAENLGINFLDSANTYQGGRSEETIGNALRGRRERFVLATKYTSRTGEGPNDRGASRYHLFNAIEASLRRLQTDHIDLYYVHNWDETTPIEEMLRSLDDLVRAGKVRYTGASNFMAWQAAQCNLLAGIHGWTPFVVSQNHYHLFERSVERELLAFCRSQGIGLIPYFPLAGGFLTGKYRRNQPPPPGSRGEDSKYVQQYMTEANYTIIEQLETWASDHAHTLGDLAHAWLLAHPEISSVISGVTRLDQLEQNARSADWVLAPEEVDDINRIIQSKG